MLLRRFVVALLFLAFGASVAEAGMADVHDGDATHSELRQYDTVIAHDDGAPVENAEHPDEPARSGHAQHTCHCAHVHFGWLANSSVSWLTIIVAVASPSARADSPASAVRSPQLRPPIV